MAAGPVTVPWDHCRDPAGVWKASKPLVVPYVRMTPRLPTTLTVIAAIAVLASPVVARVKVRADVDKSFNFGAVKTWAWRADGPGEVKMVLTKDDDPAAVQKRYEPTIVQAVQDEMARRGLTLVSDAPPDVRVAYFVLISAGTSAQEYGQFASWTAWGLPPVQFGQTQSLRMLTQGTLLLDVMPEAKPDTPVWRGIAQAEIHRERSDEERTKRLREAVRDLLKRLPSSTRR